MISVSRIRTVLLGVALLSVSGRAAGDTIVLKNGRRIVALSAVEEGAKVKYLTSAGELSLPKSIVDHIEKGGALPMAGSPGADAANLDMAPPAAQPISGGDSDAIERAAVHDGVIDRPYIAKLEGEARGGTKQANFNAARGHHVAASFEISHGDLEHALADERTALVYAPEEPALLMDVAYVHLRRSEYKQSLEYLERARRVAPDNPDVAKLEGWAYYGMNKLDQAVAEWKKALALRPDAEVRAALDKAQRDKKEEESYKENESSHFTLRYSGAAAPNDGRIRVPVQGLTAVDQELSRVLKHELTHSFVQQKTHGHAPTWIQEGLAQWMEGQRSGENAVVMAQIYSGGHAAPLGRLEGSWLNMGGDTARYAYAWALANIEYIVQADGMGDVERILDRIGAGMATEAALREVLHSDYNDVMQSAAEYLRKTYAR